MRFRESSASAERVRRSIPPDGTQSAPMDATGAYHRQMMREFETGAVGEIRR
jgi:hypothetical protein